MISDWQEYNNNIYYKYKLDGPRPSFKRFNANRGISFLSIFWILEYDLRYLVNFNRNYFKNSELLFGSKNIEEDLFEFNSLENAQEFCDEILNRFQKLKVLL